MTEETPKPGRWTQRLYVYDKDLYRRFRVIAARQDKTLTALTESWLREFIEREEAQEKG